MSSSAKTSNLQLNQWASSDPVLREDFNADNLLIDAAVAAKAGPADLLALKASLPWQLLISQDIDSAVEQIDLELDGIDPAEYSNFILVYLPNGSSATGNSPTDARLRVNGKSGNSDYVGGNFATSVTDVSGKSYLVEVGLGHAQGSNSMFTVLGVSPVAGTSDNVSRYLIRGFSAGAYSFVINGTATRKGFLSIGTCAVSSLEDLTLNIIPGTTITNGAKVRLYGLKF